MIPAAAITAWAEMAPWPDESQIEQDLLLSLLIAEIANHPFLGNELALRGGTCLHKLHLAKPLRYSEDLDYVRRTDGKVGPIFDALREVITATGLEEGNRDRTSQMAHMHFNAQPTSGRGRIRIKIETNLREVEPYENLIELPYGVQSDWFNGEAQVPTFTLEELMGTKLRALYQRRKGRERTWPRTCATSSPIPTFAMISVRSSSISQRATTSKWQLTPSWNGSGAASKGRPTKPMSKAGRGDVAGLARGLRPAVGPSPTALRVLAAITP